MLDPNAVGITWSGDITLASNSAINDSGTVNDNTSEISTGVNTSNSGSSFANIIDQLAFVLSGVISGPGSLTKLGISALDLLGANTYSGGTNVQVGTLVLAGSGSLSSAGTMNVQNGATLAFDDAVSVVPNRFTGNFTLSGGTFQIVPNNSPGAITNVTLGTITLQSGNSVINAAIGTGGSNSTLIQAAGLTRLPGATLNIAQSSTGTVGLDQFLFTTPPALTNGILPYATVASVNLATYGAAGLAPFTNYVTSLANATPTSNVQLTGSALLSKNLTVNSLVIGGGGASVISLGTFTLTVASGGLVTGAAATFSGGTLDFGSAEGILQGSANDSITSPISGSDGLTDSDTATVTLGTLGGLGNTYSGGTTLNAGTLLVDTASSLGSGTLNLTAGPVGSIGVNLPTSVPFPFAIPNAIVLNNSVVSLGAGAPIILTGPVTLAGSIPNQISAANATTLAGVISGTGSLSLAGGSGFLIITNAGNTYSWAAPTSKGGSGGISSRHPGPSCKSAPATLPSTRSSR